MEIKQIIEMNESENKTIMDMLEKVKESRIRPEDVCDFVNKMLTGAFYIGKQGLDKKGGGK